MGEQDEVSVPLQPKEDGTSSNGAQAQRQERGTSSQGDDPRHPGNHAHYSQRGNWLRAAVLGANDGLVTVGALMTGIGAASQDQRQLLLSAVSALVSGALSMAAGEYVSVSQQADTERADVEQERQAQEAGPTIRAEELEELTDIWRDRGLDDKLAKEVAEALTKHDAVRAHARDELGIDIDDHPNPWQAAAASAVSFSGGAAIPTLPLLITDPTIRYWGMVIAITIGLLFFGGLGANLGGFSPLKGGMRVLLGGWLAMIVTFGVGQLFGEDPA